MPSTARSFNWWVRVDYPRGEVVKKLQEVSQWIDFEKALAVFHLGKDKENPHFHMILTMKSELQKQSMQRRIAKHFDCKGTQFSTTVWDGNIETAGAASYLFHEETEDIVLNIGYSNEQIEHFKKLNNQVKEVVEINKERGTNKSIQKIIDKLDSTATREKIHNEIMDRIRSGEMYHPGFRFSQVIDEIYIKIQPDDHWEAVKEESWQILKEKNKWY